MESGMMIIAAVLFAVVLIPTLLIFQNTKKRSRALLEGLKTLVSKNNGTLTLHIEQTNFALGIDEIAKKFYFFKKTEEGEILKEIDLNSVTSCEISSKIKRIKKDKGHDELVEKITLLFVSKKNNETEQIELYNEEDTLLTDELAIAEDWKKIIQDLLSNTKKVSEGEKKPQVLVSMS